MQVQTNVSLKAYNSFGIDVNATNFIELENAQQLEEVFANSYLPQPIRVIGGGSNILLTEPVKGTVLLNRIKGITLLEENEEHVLLEVLSGEVWHDFVLYAINKGWGGIENLALIPGTVGAAPMQNIGAYGVEVKDVIANVRAWHWIKGKYIDYDNEACKFGYRDSIFKQKEKGKVFITSVTFKLQKKHTFNTNYGAIQEELDKQGIKELSIKAVADAVIAIRSSKLPDPKLIGNAGSFFKNPTIGSELFNKLIDKYPKMPSYPVDKHRFKIPAGWLIEKCGFKGVKQGNTGVHEKQALVLINSNGNATGLEIWRLSEEILQSVLSRFNILLEREVQIW
ncbi:MAG: UDP-N-acetylmuramate dehydrogenase [Flavipsychrobacter sp.]